MWQLLLLECSRSIVDGSTSSFSCSFPVLAEARAVWDATIFAHRSTNVPVIIESDCKEVIDAISGQASFLPWDNSGLVDSIRDLVNNSNKIPISFVPREANGVAHWIASKVKSASLPLDWTFNVPSNLAWLFEADFPPSGIG